jgi:hypothetical protein
MEFGLGAGAHNLSWDTHGLIMGFGLSVKGHSLSYGFALGVSARILSISVIRPHQARLEVVVHLANAPPAARGGGE